MLLQRMLRMLLYNVAILTMLLQCMLRTLLYSVPILTMLLHSTVTNITAQCRYFAYFTVQRSYFKLLLHSTVTLPTLVHSVLLYLRYCSVLHTLLHSVDNLPMLLYSVVTLTMLLHSTVTLPMLVHSVLLYLRYCSVLHTLLHSVDILPMLLYSVVALTTLLHNVCYVYAYVERYKANAHSLLLSVAEDFCFSLQIFLSYRRLIQNEHKQWHL